MKTNELTCEHRVEYCRILFYYNNGKRYHKRLAITRYLKSGVLLTFANTLEKTRSVKSCLNQEGKEFSRELSGYFRDGSVEY